MKCPTCTATAIVMSARQGAEIDDGPQCRGVWLDRGRSQQGNRKKSWLSSIFN